MVCLTTVSKYNQKIMNFAVYIFFVNLLNLIISLMYHVLVDFHCLPVRQRSLNYNLSGLRSRKVAPVDYIDGGHLRSRAVAYLGFHFGGGSKYFCKSGGNCMARGEATRLARGVRGHAPPRKFLKMVQFGAFWRIFC